MSRVVKERTVRYRELVGSDELLLRRLGLLVPEFYRLTPYQLKQTKGYVDKSYTKVTLLDGRVVATRDAMSFLPKRKPTKSVAGLYGETTQSAVNLSSIISKKPSYTGLPYHQVTFTWYHRAKGGRITMINPNNRYEYILDCYAFCDCKASWNQLQGFVEAFMRLMIHSQCKMINRYEQDIDRVDQLQRLFYGNRKLTVMRELGEEIELNVMPEAIERILLELDDLSFTDDDKRTSDDRDVRTLLTMIKLSQAVSKFTVDITIPLLDIIGERYAKKPYMEKFIKEIFAHRRVPSTMLNYKNLIRYHSENLRLRDLDSDFILGYTLYERMKLKTLDPIYIKQDVLKKLPVNHQARRILKTLGLMRVVVQRN